MYSSLTIVFDPGISITALYFLPFSGLKEKDPIPNFSGLKLRDAVIVFIYQSPHKIYTLTLTVGRTESKLCRQRFDHIPTFGKELNIIIK
jgi:hypothetical protein